MADKNRSNTALRTIILWSVIGFLIFLLFNALSQPDSRDRIVLDETGFMQLVAGEYPAGKLKHVKVDKSGHQVEVQVAVKNANGDVSLKTGTVNLASPYSREDTRALMKQGVTVDAESPNSGAWMGLFVPMVPMFLIIGIWIFMMRRMGAGGAGVLQFGKSKARQSKVTNVTFADVAGCEEAKEDLRELVAFLKNPEKFQKLGARIPKGVLLMGPPGTGKTLLARAVAGEANVPFFSVSGSDFVEMFVGVGASRVRDLFETGKKASPCILFFDELDAIGKMRGTGIGGGHDEREQTLNQILVEMDGFEQTDKLIVIAATNRSDVLDEALIRPGRFDRQVVVPRPDLLGREAILKVHARKIKLDPSADLSLIARGTPGMSGADLANIINEAALIATVRGAALVSQSDLDNALETAQMGRERKSAVMSPEEKRKTAWHEAGHALVAEIIHKEDPKHSDPNHKVTIIPRGMALGLTQQLPVADRMQYSKRFLLNRIAVLMGGRAAEELLGERDNDPDSYTTGAGNDLERATELANKMARTWSMEKSLGPRTFGHRSEVVFLGRQVDQEKDYSEAMAAKIDDAVSANVTERYTYVVELLRTRLEVLAALAQELFERETLSAADITRIVWGSGSAVPSTG